MLLAEYVLGALADELIREPDPSDRKISQQVFIR
jgi:hypothetical protein